MAKKKSLAQWCKENEKEQLIKEIDCDKNSRWYSSDYIPNRIEYTSPQSINWICEKGHQWSCEVVARTLFGLDCPICNPSGAVLPIGTKYGCLSIINDFESYKKEIAEPKIRELQKSREDFLNGIRNPFSNVDSVEFYDNWIRRYKNEKKYKCQCKCGKIHYLDQFSFLETKRRYCTQAVTERELNHLKWTSDFMQNTSSNDSLLAKYCGLAVKAWKTKQQAYNDNGHREYAENYDVNYAGTTYESLYVLECTDTEHEERYRRGDLRRKDAYCYKIYKVYKAKCYLCGKEHMIKCSQFGINPPTQYGTTAYNGYWSRAKCDCHEISSFQWIVNKILIENKVPYRVEYAFPDLYGTAGVNKLRFDFAILNEDNTIKCLIECQGEQHYMPVEEFGGNRQHILQQKNDKLKKEYALNHNIPLIEISFKDKKYDKLIEILASYKIITKEA